ncbi:MAG: RdgB/HAM1 family non-canonical purine NTP pyrophosphatase [Ruminococcaceae bacterium]|nr:RdgB/HAM1 family non-canonical purine NTP pyrophosphatase [Oscillospiraceae bacterium]
MKLKFVIASGNKHKIEEIKAILQSELDCEISVISMKEAGFTEDIEENGTTFFDNAYIKANALKNESWFSIADDSGLSVDCLDGAPGVYSARFAGEPCNDKNNNNKLLSLMENVPAEKRTAHFDSVIVCITPDGDCISAMGRCPGTILTAPRGTGGFGYDPLFYYESLNKTFAELTAEEKNSISHRAKSMHAFAGELKKYLKNFANLLKKHLEEHTDVNK